MLCTLIFGVQLVYCQNYNSLRKEADALFLKQQYQEAKPKFRQLLALDQKNVDFNYKYGVCIYETENKLNSRKYFDLILQQGIAPIKTSYYRGKIYQYEYEFDKAISEFERCKKDKLLIGLADSEISSCQSAKEQIKLKSNLVVRAKFETQVGNHEKFYQLSERFSFYSPDKGEIFEKQNSKLSFKPKYLFKRGMKYRIFASYSEKKENGLDIFLQIKDANDQWGELSRIPLLSTVYDEDFPFYDDSTQTLYFASKGHNSIGGFDIFKVAYDWKTNTVGEVINLGFPYNSTSDDYLFVPDNFKNSAYFTTNRGGDLSRAEVLLVSLDKIDNDIVSSMSQWVDEVDNEQKSVNIIVRNIQSNESFGPFVSDDKGKIFIYFPTEGQYEYTIEHSVYREIKNFKKIVDIPKIGEGERIEQTLRYFMQNSTEELEISTRVKYIEEQEEINPLKLQEISKLSINAKSIGDSPSATAGIPLDVFVKLNIRESDKQVALEKLVDILLDKEIDMENNERFRVQANEKIKANNDMITSIRKEIEVRKKVVPSDEQIFDKELSQDNNQLQELLEENLVLMNHIERQNQLNEIRPNLDDVTLLNKELNEIRNTTSIEDTEKYIQSKLDVIKKSLAIVVIPPNEIKTDLQQKTLSQLNKNEEELRLYKVQIDSLKNEVSSIENELKSLSKKKQESKQEELSTITKKIIGIEELSAEVEFQNKVLVSEKSAFEKNDDLIEFISDESLKIKEIGLITQLNNQDISKEDIITQIMEVTQNNNIQTPANTLAEIKRTYHNDKIGIDLIKDPEEKVRKQKQAEEIFLKELSAISREESEEVIELIQLTQSRITDLSQTIKFMETEKEIAKNNSELINNQNTNKEENIAKNENTNKEENVAKNENTNKEENIAKNENTNKEENIAKNQNTNKEENIAKNENTNKEENVAKNENTNKEENVAKNENINKEENVAKNENTTKSEIVAKNQNTKEENVAKNENTTKEENIAKNENTTKSENVAKNQNTKEENVAKNENTTKEENIAKNENTTKEENIAKNENTNKEENLAKNENTTKSENVAKNENTNKEENIAKNENTENIVENRKASDNKGKQQIDNTESLNASREQESIKTKIYVDSQLKQLENLSETDGRNKETLTSSERNTLNNIKDRTTEKEQLLIQKEKIESLLGSSSEKQLAQSITIKSTQIDKLENEIKQEKNEKVRRILEQEKTYLTEELKSIQGKTNQNIAKSENTIPSSKVDNSELKSLLTSEEYASYAKDRLALARSVNATNDIQQQLGKLTHKYVSSSKVLTDPEKSILQDSIVWLQNQFLENQKNTTELTTKLLNYQNQAKFETMVLQKEQPVILTAPVTIDAAKTFSFVKKDDSSFDGPLPITDRKLGGLLFRVQVGAFRKAVPSNLFREFTPVNGEVIPNGLTCYMAGFFNNSLTALQAQTEIRSLGYSDAFVVAYCDGKRIPIEQGRLYEKNKLCISLSDNELTIKLQQLLEEERQSPQAQTINEQNKQVDKPSVDEYGVEIAGYTDHLYFSVQVGVFNRSLNPVRLKGINELIIHKAANGQLRYSSGRFENLADAKLRKTSVNTNGIADAFIVAYYKGKRITFAEAQQMIERNPSIAKVARTENMPARQVENKVLTSEAANLDFNVIRPVLDPKRYYYAKDTKEGDVWNTMDITLPCSYNPSSELSFTQLFDSPFSAPEVVTSLAKFQLKEFNLNSLGKVVFDISRENSGEILNHMMRSSYMYEVKNNKILVYPLNRTEKEQLLTVKEQLEEE